MSRMRSVLWAALIFAMAFVLAPGATSAATWHSEQPVATGIEVPVGLGEVGDIEFWAPNRGVLITAGDKGMPPGVYAYDGVSWHLYSTVCGGHEGRIAWAGPTEFWTVSDYQVAPPHVNGESELWRRTLCHFQGGKVVASYAEPLESPDAYLPINAAACNGPDDCWFAGERLGFAGEIPATRANHGAFHLHWNGSSLATVPSLEVPEALEDPGRTVEGLAYWGGQLFESVEVQSSDVAPGEEELAQPSFIHQVQLGSPRPFDPLVPMHPYEFGAGEPPEALGAFHLAPGLSELWAVSGANTKPVGGVSTEGVEVTALRFVEGEFRQVALSQSSTEPTFTLGTKIWGAAAEPGNGLWVSYCHMNEGCEGTGVREARLAHISATGEVEAEEPLPRPSEDLNEKGFARSVACPAYEQCWAVTNRGWLFHLGGALPQDANPEMHVLITERPRDDSVPTVPSLEIPRDNSGAEPGREKETELPIRHFKVPHQAKSRPLVGHLKQKVVHKTILQLTFALRARAHVQLIAKRKGKVVAETAKMILPKGHHRIRLRLDPKHWPTGLDFQVHPAKGKKK
jgi:hypothetical protein